MSAKLKYLLSILIIVTSFQIDARNHYLVVRMGGSDRIMLRDGNELYVNILQVDDEKVVYSIKKKNAPQEILDLGEVYMLEFESRGNVYITKDGKRKTGENQEIPKKADVIYLVSGKEIPAYEVQVNEDKITYLIQPRKKKTMIPIAEVLNPSDVFMIKYHDGTKDIINKIPTKKELEEIQAAAVRQEEIKEEPKAPEMKVVFYSVKRGDTLVSIADEYGVTPDDLKEWNDLPANLKKTARLRAEMQLMIYVQSDQL